MASSRHSRDGGTSKGPTIPRDRSKARAPAAPSISPDDTIIAVMGVTGAGKSTFISLLIEEEIGIGHDLQSCTNSIGIYSCKFRGRRVFLIDTPGFDDTHRSDTDVLTDVAYFLSSSYEEEIRLTGIIYLHRITDVRMQGSALKNLSMFKKLCGKNYFQNVVLATTMWSDASGKISVSADTGRAREQELIETPHFWGAMYQRGSKIHRHTGKRESAEEIIAHLIGLRLRPVLDIQHEMVDQGKKVSDTAAGMEVQRELQATKAQHVKDIEELHKNFEDAMKNRDLELADLIAKEREKSEENLRKAIEDSERLEAGLKQLRKDKDEQYEQLVEKFNYQKEAHEQALQNYKKELKKYEAKHDKSERQLKKMQDEYKKMLEDQEQYNNTDTSKSGAAAMMVGMGIAALSVLTMNPFGIVGGATLYKAGADRAEAKQRNGRRPQKRDGSDDDYDF